MPASILNSKIVGVSFNSLHIEKGNLILNDQTITRKVTKIGIDENNPFSAIELGNIHKAYNSMFAENLISSYPTSGTEFLVNDVISFRSLESVKINFPENIVFNSDGSFTNGFIDNDSNNHLKDLLFLLKEKFFKPSERFVDYNPPKEDLYYYDLFGFFTIDGEFGKAFEVERIEVNNVNPYSEGNNETEPEPVVSWSGAPTSVIGLDHYFTLDKLEFSLAEAEQNGYSLPVTHTYVGSGNKSNFIMVGYFDTTIPFEPFDYSDEYEFFNSQSVNIEGNKINNNIGKTFAFLLFDINDWYNETNLIPSFEVQVLVTE